MSGESDIAGSRRAWRAPQPFDDADADLIIRSSNGDNFRVYRIIISIASPDLKRRIAALPPAANGPPVLDLAVSTPVLDNLLRLCYPVLNPTFFTAEHLEPVLKASIQYGIEAAVGVLKERLRTNSLSWDPLKVYACACRLALIDEARQAAQWLQHRPPADLDSPLLDDIPALDYIRLITANRRKDTSGTSWPYQLSQANRQETARSDVACFSQPEKAPSLFDNISEADIILRSCDAVDFYACRSILSLATPFFRDMFTLPQSIGGSTNRSADLATVPVTEDSVVLNDLLRLCYPPQLGDDLLFEDLDRLRSVLSAAMKYDMQGVAKVLCSKLIARASEDPGGVYAVAQSLNIDDVSKAAAKLTLRMDLTGVETSPHWKHVMACDFRRLQHYHINCGASVAGAFKVTGSQVPSWFTKGVQQWMTCPCRAPSNGTPVGALFTHGTVLRPYNWTAYMKECEALLRSRPGDSSIAAFEHALPHIVNNKSLDCSACRRSAPTDIVNMQVFCKELEAQITRRIDEASIPKKTHVLASGTSIIHMIPYRFLSQLNLEVQDTHNLRRGAAFRGSCYLGFGAQCRTIKINIMFLLDGQRRSIRSKYYSTCLMHSCLKYMHTLESCYGFNKVSHM
jgi:hypothetical protein